MKVRNFNYFDVAEADKWYCSVKKISKDGKLLLQAFKPYTREERFLIEFTSVLYIDLPTLWEGVNFYLGEHSELLSLLLSLRAIHAKTKPDELSAVDYKLFKVDLQSASRFASSVRIVAREAKKIASK